MNIIQKLIPSGTLRRSGLRADRITFGVCHDTGNDNSTALANVNYYIQSANMEEASAHIFVDDLGAIVCIPVSGIGGVTAPTEKAWHVRHVVGIDKAMFGAVANDAAIAVELCYGPAWTPARNAASYTNYVQLWALICKQFALDPRTKLVGHCKLDPTRRQDPLNAFRYMGRTWDQFVDDVSAQLVQITPVPVPVPVPATDCSAEVKAGQKSLIQKIIAFLNSLIS